MRERFLQDGLDGFLDYEIVELLLTLGTPRKDCKLVATFLQEKIGREKKEHFYILALDSRNNLVSLKEMLSLKFCALSEVKGMVITMTEGIKIYKTQDKI